MFANTFQSGLLSIFYSVGSNPLQLWDKQVKNGHIRRIVDDEVRSLVLEISGTNVATTYITCPIKPRLSLGIKLPFLVMIIKNMKKYFTFEIQILDDKDMHRRFRVSNFQSTTKVRPFCTTMPIGLSSGWNQVQFNLADFTKRAYGSTYLETTRVQIHANVRIRRIYFSDVLYADDELPNEYKLFLPTAGGPPRPSKSEKKESISKDKKEEKKTSVAAGLPEAEPPSGALPSPESPNVEDMPPTTPEEPPSEPLTVITETVEPQSESPTVGPMSEEITTEPETEVFVDAVAEGEMFEGAPTEAPQGEVPPAESEQAPAETKQVVDASEAPTEAPAAEASAEEKPVEEAAPAVAPTEEAPLQETPAAQEEAPLPESPAEEAPSAEAPPEAEPEPAAETN